MRIGIRTVGIVLVLALVGCAEHRMATKPDLPERIRIRGESVRAYNEQAIRLKAEADDVTADFRALAKHPLAPVLRPKLEAARAQAVVEVPGDTAERDAAFRTFVDDLHLTPEEEKVWRALQTLLVRYQRVMDWNDGMKRWRADLVAEEEAIRQEILSDRREIERRHLAAAEEAAGAQSLSALTGLMRAVRPAPETETRLKTSCTTNRVGGFIQTNCW